MVKALTGLHSMGAMIALTREGAVFVFRDRPFAHGFDGGTALCNYLLRDLL